MKALVLIFFLIGCSSSKTSDRYREGDNTGQKVALTVPEEQKLTKEALPAMMKDYPPAKDPKLQAYISRLGQNIVRLNELHKNPYEYTFTVVDVAQVNAFAMPAGSVFITAPIIAMADTEAELAGVVGHEIGHVTARHTAERMYQAKKEEGKSWLYGGLGALLGAGAGYYLGGKYCDPKDQACKNKFALYGGGAGAGAGLLVQKYKFMKNSQEDELESDRVGFRYAVNAGYDKNKVGDFYKKLQAMEEQAKRGNTDNPLLGWVADAMASHPPSKERVAQSQELRSIVQGDGKITTTPEFFEMKKRAQSLVDKNKIVPASSDN